MTKILHNPAIITVVAVLAGLAGGLVPLWRASQLLVTQVATGRVVKANHLKDQGWDFWTIEVDNLAAELKDEKARMAKLSEQLDLRAARVTAEQKELDKLRANLEATRKEISDRVIEISADEMKNLRSLSQTYTNLTPRAAVAIIREMDDITVVKILSLMKADVVAPIFEEMSKTPDQGGLLARRAAILSEKLRLMKSSKPAATS
jgi:flagellar motility protein MotE (MotC chaperone)